MKQTNHITQKQLSGKKYPTLEDILAFVNGGKYERFFLNKVKVLSDGGIKSMTKKGARVYQSLVAILNACAKVTDTDLYATVEELDHISDQSI